MIKIEYCVIRHLAILSPNVVNLDILLLSILQVIMTVTVSFLDINILM